MRQARANRTLGAIVQTIKWSNFWLGFGFQAIALYGWHQLVFKTLIPSWWVFLGLFGVAFGGLVALQYFVLMPAELSFLSQQTRRHDPAGEDGGHGRLP